MVDALLAFKGPFKGARHFTEGSRGHTRAQRSPGRGRAQDAELRRWQPTSSLEAGVG